VSGPSFTYDDENRLTFITSGTSWRTGFVYDGLGRMRKQIAYAWISSAWVAQSTNEYVYDGKRNVPTVAYTRGNPGHKQCRTIVFVS
jgi:YD repeat-containing protein